MTTYNWEPDKKQRFFDMYGFYPEQANFDANTLPGFAPSSVSNFPKLNESYSIPRGSISSDVASQVDQQVRANAMSEEAWELEKLKVIKSANRQELAIALATDTMPNLQDYRSVTSKSSRESTKKAAVNLEKVAINKAFLENPPTTKAQVIEFIETQDLSPEGWEWVKKIAPMFDWGDTVEWKKLMPDGSVSFRVSRKGDLERNTALRDANYRTGSVEDDRKFRAEQKFAEASEDLHKFLDGATLTQEKLDQYFAKNTGVLFDPAKVAAISKIATLSDLKPAYDTFTVIKDGFEQDGAKRNVGYQFPVRTGTDSWKKFISNEHLTVLSDTDAYNIQLDKIRKNAMDEIHNDMQSKIDKGDFPGILNDPLVMQEAINAQGFAVGNKTFGFKYDPEKDGKELASRLGISRDAARNLELFEAQVLAFINESDKLLPDIRKEVSKYFHNMNKAGLNLPDSALDKALARIGVMREPQKFTETIKMPAQSVVKKIGDNIVIVNQPEGQYVRTGDDSVTQITGGQQTQAGKYLGTTDRGYFIEKDDESRIELIKPEWLEKDITLVNTNVTELVKKPTEYWDAHNTYNQMYDQIDAGIEDEDAWALIDQRIVTLAIKLVDTSMVTESEFDSFASKAGVGDKIKHQLRKWQTGEPLTEGQKRAVLLMSEKWLTTKQQAVQTIANSLKSTFERRYPETTTELPPGYGIDDLFSAGGMPLEFLREVPRDAKVFMESSDAHKKFFGITGEEVKEKKAFNASEEVDRLDKGGDIVIEIKPKKQFRPSRLGG